jgi:phosphoglycerol transferase MdoB-like AlkP superfamily enzyme
MAKMILTGWFGPALLLLFIALKLCGVITWSWWWVLAPGWLPIAAGLGVALACLLLLALISGFQQAIRHFQSLRNRTTDN